MDATRIAHQMELERLFSKNQLLPRIRAEFIEAGFESIIEDAALDKAFGIDLLTQMALHKRADLPTLVGLLRHHFKVPNAGQACTYALLKAAMEDLINWDPVAKVFIVIFTITEEVQQELDRFQFPLPMVVPPKEVQHNAQTGYLVDKGSIILKQNHHTDDVCLDHVNRVNRIKLCINFDVATTIKNQWRNLDRPKDGETHQDFKRRVRAFDKYDKNAKDVLELLLKEGNDFYLTHRYDKRGRTYAMGYYVNYQAAPWNKAVVNFSDQEITNG